MNTEPALRTDHYPADHQEDRICYWKNSDGFFMIYIPKIGVGQLKKHEVEEHEDGTVSVSPSIVLSNGHISRHGLLKRGIWEEV